jgi:hypothetical protein
MYLPAKRESNVAVKHPYFKGKIYRSAEIFGEKEDYFKLQLEHLDGKSNKADD